MITIIKGGGVRVSKEPGNFRHFLIPVVTVPTTVPVPVPVPAQFLIVKFSLIPSGFYTKTTDRVR